MAAIEAEARAWARHLATGRPTTVDAQAFLQWRAQSPAHTLAWAEASRDWRNVGQIAHAFRVRQAHPETAPVSSQRRWFLGAAASAVATLGVAAVAAPPLGLWPSWSELDADYRTAIGEQRDILLDGQVRLLLNTRTSVALRPEAGMTRIELIAGEAAVQNPRRDPMEIVAGEGRIRLEAGEVEVRWLAGGKVRVFCTEGRAELRHPAQRLALQARDEVSYGSARVGAPSQVAVNGESAWRHGVVVFDDMALPDAVDEINRYRPGRVVLLGDRLAQQHISGRFRIGALDQAIAQIQQLYGADIRTLGNMVVLS